MDAPAHDDADHLCSIAGDDKGWATHVHATFPEHAKSKTTKTAKAATTTGPIDDNGVPKPDKWMHGKLYHWENFFGYMAW